MDSSQSSVFSSTSQGQNSVTASQFPLSDIIEDLFLVLTHKEKEVVVKRFSLNNQPRETLEKIGQHFNVTRERIRQIEKIALSKLRRTVGSTRLHDLSVLAKNLLQDHGGVMLETKIVNEILKIIYSQSEIDIHIIKLVAEIDSEIECVTNFEPFESFWKFQNLRIKDIQDVTDKALDLLTKKGDIVKHDKLLFDIEQAFSEKERIFTKAFIESTLDFDIRIKSVDGHYGLSAWRHVNPRSIRDKAYIILKKAKKSMHFIEIANQIAQIGFDRKVVTTQAVHNELIRYDQFVLVGRGLYALREWGYNEGTVSDIIEMLLKNKSPMTKQEIIEGVLKQRQVKKGTISLNLQKNPRFLRVGRAVYSYKA